jgi:hypothetical protein
MNGGFQQQAVEQTTGILTLAGVSGLIRNETREERINILRFVSSSMMMQRMF